MDKEQTETVENTAENQAKTQAPEKKERKKHEQRQKRPRHQRPTEQWNADLITEDTVLEPLPKKGEILAQPKRDDYKKRQQDNRKKVSALIQKKQKIQNQKFKSEKAYVKGQGNKFEEFQVEIDQFKQIKERYFQVKKERDNKRDQLTRAIQQAKQNNANLKKYRQSEKSSKQYFQQQLQKMQHRLITSQLSKQQQKNLNSEIVTLKRKVKQAQSVGNVEIKIAKAEQEKERLDSQIQKIKQDKQPLEKQCKQLREKMDEKNAIIQKLKSERKVQSQQKQTAKAQVNQQHEDWKQKKKKRVQDINNQIKRIDEENEKIWNEYHQKNDAYWDQKHKLDFLEWQYRVKERKIRDKKRALAAEKQKQKQKQENLKKYIKQIQLCNFLINYIKDLTKEQKQVKEESKTQEPKDINAKLGQDAQWKKQKGLVVIQSKKSKEDEEPAAKKGKKGKKKGEKAEQKKQKFEIPFNIQVIFDQIKVLPPDSLEQCQKKIQQIKQRETLFQRACGENASEEDKQQVQKIRNKDKKQKKEDQNSANKKEQEFPTL